MLRNAFLLFLALAGFVSFAIFPTVSIFPVRALSQENSGAPPKPLDERLGADDGAAVALLFGANMRGNMDVCDCTHPRGGLARRIGFVQTYKKKFPETALVQIEAGFLWYNSESQATETIMQNDFVTRAYSRWPMDVINLGRYDMFYANRLLLKDGIVEKSAQLPMIKNLISANGVYSDTVAAPAPYLIKEVTGPRLKGAKKKLRIGFLGLAEPIRGDKGMRDAVVKDMFASARQYVPELRKKCDVLVILAHAERDGAMKLAAENPEADVVISGNAEGYYQPRQVGTTMVVFAAPGNTQESELRLYLARDGKITYKFQTTDLDAGVPSDPEALKFADEARQALFKYRTR